jgi:NADH-quinone oxidoreductase subunit N
MATDLVLGLLPDHLLLALLLVLMAGEMAGIGARAARGLFIMATLGATIVLLWQLSSGYTADIVPGEIRVDRLALIGKAVIVGCGLLLGAAFDDLGTPKTWMLVTSSLLGGQVLMESSGFISLFMGIEMLSLPAFALMVHQAGSTSASEGAFKYLLLSSLASALVLFGISLSYGVTGNLTTSALASAVASGPAQLVAAAILIIAGLALKAAVFPLHGWAPDAYSSVGLRVTAFLASVVKAAVVLTLVRIFAVAPLPPALSAIIIVLGILSIVYGNVTAINQRQFRRMLAYSSIAHAGYMIFAMADTSGGRVDDLLWYAGIYATMTILACASFVALCPQGGDDLDALDGGFSRRPVAALVLAFSVLSLAGIPPLPGFFAKLFVFRSVIASGHLVAAVLAFVGSFIGLTYYVAIVARLFRTAAAGEPVGRAGA